MKNSIIAMVAFACMSVDCKQSEGNKNVIKMETDNQPKAYIVGSNSYTYRGLDGIRAKVVFNNTDKDKTVMVQANNNRIELDRKSDANGEIHYERAGITAVAKGDSLIITQDGNVIPLKWDN